tara:strand:+ start:346 stop:1254 length:909 start_codon:yes stop_codon:yes gene_type:complete
LVTLPSNIDFDILIDNLRKISWEAYDILIYYSQILRDTNKKNKIIENHNKDNPVTLADLKVNELIINGIKEKYKNINWEILSEENEKVHSSEGNLNSDWIWILDPLDGTKDFIQGTGNYAMHLALNYKNKPYIGIVLIPEKNELWISTRSRAWCENRNQVQKNPNLLRNRDFGDMIIATSKNHRNEVLRKLINLINFKKVSVIGSVGCKVSSILRGESDIYISLSLPGGSAPKDWDFAAPSAILIASGGAITNLDNEELTFNQRNFEQRGIIIASSDKKHHYKICSKIKEIIREYDLYPLNA